MRLRFPLPLLTLLLVVLTACQSDPPRQDRLTPQLEEALGENQAAAKAPPPGNRLPPEVGAALLPPLGGALPGEQRPLGEPRFDIAVNAAPAAEFFMGLVKNTAYNVIVHPDVSGAITLNLKNVTIPEVMETVRDVYGYDFQRTAGGFQVLPVRLRSQVFQVDYLNVVRSGSSQTRITAGRQGGSGSSSGGDSGGGVNAGASINTKLNDQDTFWSEIEGSVKTIIGEAEGRSVAVNPQAGIVVVRAMPAELREVAAFLKQAESNIGRQVILEAKILEVRLNDGNQSGINWAFMNGSSKAGVLAGQFPDGRVIDLVNPTSGSFIPFGQPTVDSAGNYSVDTASGQIARSSGLAGTPAAGFFTAALYLNNFAAFIDLLKTQGDVQVLSSPRVSTLNNQKALIKVGTDDYFVVNINAGNAGTATTTATTPTPEFAPFFSGVALDVTPQVNGDGMVTLHIHPMVSQVVDKSKTLVISNQTSTFPLASSSTREADSVVRAANGQVVVIGGLLNDSTSNDTSKVPGLGDVPVLGEAFQHKSVSHSKSELVILLRPMVVDDGRVWRDDLRRTTDRFRGYQPPPQSPE